MAQAGKYAKETAQENYARNNGWSASLEISITMFMRQLVERLYSSFKIGKSMAEKCLSRMKKKIQRRKHVQCRETAVVFYSMAKIRRFNSKVRNKLAQY